MPTGDWVYGRHGYFAPVRSGHSRGTTVRESIVQLVFFIAVVSVATLFVGLVVTQTAVFSESVDREGERSAAEIDAEIVLINDPETDAYDAEDETVTLYVKNVGGSTLEPERLDVLVEGDLVEGTDARVVEGDRWRPERVLEVTIDRDLSPGEYRTLVRIDGADDHFNFEHRIAFWKVPDNATCTDGTCTVENETVDLEMATERPQVGEDVEFSVNDTETATVVPDEAETDDEGTAETTLEFEEETVTVTLDVGWDTDDLVVRYEDDSGDE